MSVTCDYCGSALARATDQPDCTRIDCPICGATEFLWKDNEYEWDWEDELHTSVDDWGEDDMP